jgi:DNA-binding MarR family transcriptional regulator
MQLGLAPGNQAAVIPDKAVTVVEGDHGHGVFLTATYCKILGLGRRRQAAARYTAENTFSITEVASYVNMTDIKSAGPPFSPVEDEVRQGIELLFFAYRDFTAEPDAILAQYGFGRAHHRVIHFVGRHPQMTVGELLDILKITKQSLSRVLGQLVQQGFIVQYPGPRDRRQRLLDLTPKGRELERQLSEPQRARVANAYSQAGSRAVEGFRKVLLGIIADEGDRRRFLK